MIVRCNGYDFLCMLLSDHIFIQFFFYPVRGRDIVDRENGRYAVLLFLSDSLLVSWRSAESEQIPDIEKADGRPFILIFVLFPVVVRLLILFVYSRAGSIAIRTGPGLAGILRSIFV